MLSKIVVALLATSMIAAPVLAQSTMPSPRAPASQPAKIPAATPTVNATKPAIAKVIKVKRHKVKRVKIAKHATPVRHFKAPKHMTVGNSKLHATSKPAVLPHTN